MVQISVYSLTEISLKKNIPYFFKKNFLKNLIFIPILKWTIFFLEVDYKKNILNFQFSSLYALNSRDSRICYFDYAATIIKAFGEIAERNSLLDGSSRRSPSFAQAIVKFLRLYFDFNGKTRIRQTLLDTIRRSHVWFLIQLLYFCHINVSECNITGVQQIYYA